MIGQNGDSPLQRNYGHINRSLLLLLDSSRQQITNTQLISSAYTRKLHKEVLGEVRCLR
jgi:hypothetical protein